MQLSTRHDVDMPAEALFDRMADFDRIERIVIRRGAKVTRQATSGTGLPGWNIGFKWRGQQRDIDLAVTRLERPTAINLEGKADGVTLAIAMDVVALSKTRSRLIFEFGAVPQSLKMRLLVQTLKLGRDKLTRRLSQAVADYLADRSTRG